MGPRSSTAQWLPTRRPGPQRGANWPRSIAGIGGDLAAIQESSGTISSNSPTCTVLWWLPLAPACRRKNRLPTSNSMSGVPMKGSAGRYGWLGKATRRTELPSGVIQMGVRSYVPASERFLSPDPVVGDRQMHMSTRTRIQSTTSTWKGPALRRTSVRQSVGR
jgi:hypothetical protein